MYDTLHVDAGRVDFVGVEFAGFDEVLDLRDRDATRGGGRRVEVAGACSVDEVAVAVALPGVHERVIGDDAAFEHVGFAVELPGLFRLRREGDAAVTVVAQRESAFLDGRADTCRGEEGGDARTTGAQALGERALRSEFDFEFTGEVLARELLVGADVRRDGAADAALLEQQAEPEAVGTAVVADGLEVGGA